MFQPFCLSVTHVTWSHSMDENQSHKTLWLRGAASGWWLLSSNITILWTAEDGLECLVDS